jgi:hypothetical protein
MTPLEYKIVSKEICDDWYLKKESFCVEILKIYNFSFCKNVSKKGKYQKTGVSMFHAVFFVRHAILRCIRCPSHYFAVHLLNVTLFYARQVCVITKA